MEAFRRHGRRNAAAFARLIAPAGRTQPLIGAFQPPASFQAGGELGERGARDPDGEEYFQSPEQASVRSCITYSVAWIGSIELEKLYDEHADVDGPKQVLRPMSKRRCWKIRCGSCLSALWSSNGRGWSLHGARPHGDRRRRSSSAPYRNRSRSPPSHIKSKRRCEDGEEQPGYGLGAVVGFVAAGPSPLLLITVPLGMPRGRHPLLRFRKDSIRDGLVAWIDRQFGPWFPPGTSPPREQPRI